MSNFAEVILDPNYSNGATFGPEFQTTITKSLSGISQADVSRYDYITKGKIDYGLLKPGQKAGLRRFHIYRFGMAQGFRVYAPDDHLSGSSIAEPPIALPESLGLKATGTVVGGGTEFPVQKSYTDGGMAAPYVRRICKLDWTQPFTVTYTAGGIVTQTITPEFPATLYDGTVPHYGYSADFTTVRVDYILGIVRIINAEVATIDGASPIYWTGSFHTPMRFMNDWNSISHDSTHGEYSSVELCEMLPAELGIT